MKRFLNLFVCLSVLSVWAEDNATENGAGFWMPQGQAIQDAKAGSFAVKSPAIRGNYPTFAYNFAPMDLSDPSAKISFGIKVDTDDPDWRFQLRLYGADGDGWYSFHIPARMRSGAMEWQQVELELSKGIRNRDISLQQINKIMLVGDHIIGASRRTVFTVDGLTLTVGGKEVPLSQGGVEEAATENLTGSWTPRVTFVDSELGIGEKAASSGIINGNYPVFTLRIPEIDLSDPDLKLVFFARVDTNDPDWNLQVRFSGMVDEGFAYYNFSTVSGNMQWGRFEVPIRALRTYKTIDLKKVTKIIFVGNGLFSRQRPFPQTQFFIDGLYLEKKGESVPLFQSSQRAGVSDTPAPVTHPVVLYRMNDIERARENIRRHQWATQLYDFIKQSAQFWIDFPEDQIAAWIPEEGGFHVNCPKCHLGDTLKPDALCTRLECNNCHEVFPSENYPETSSYEVTTPTGRKRRIFYYEGEDQFIHRENIGNRYHLSMMLNYYKLDKIRNNLYNLALLYALDGKPEYARKVRIALVRLAEVYPDFVPKYRATAYAYGEHLMAGKMFSWKIHDSGLISNLAIAYDLTVNAGCYSDEDKVKIENGIFREYRELMISALPEFGDWTKNGTPAHLIASTYTALLLNDRDLLLLVLNGQNGFKHFIRTYFKRDGSSAESSPAYNNMSTRPLAGVVAALSGSEFDVLSEVPELKELFRSVARALMPSGHPLAIGDSDETSTYRVADAEIVYRSFTTDENRLLLNMALQTGGGGWIESLFFRDPGIQSDPAMALPQFVRQSMILPGREVALLRFGGLDNTLPETALAFYHNGTAPHGHQDSLNLTYYKFNRELLTDLGYLSYPHKWTPFLQSVLSHNTVFVDGNPQTWGRKVQLEYFSGSFPVQSVSASAQNIYPQISTFRRSTVMICHSAENSYLVDTFLVAGGNQHSFIIHGDGALIAPELDYSPMDKVSVAKPEAGSNYIFEAYSGYIQGDFVCSWQSDKGGEKIISKIYFFNSGVAELIKLNVPGLRNRRTPTADVRMFPVIWRTNGPESHFVSVIDAFKGESLIQNCRRISLDKKQAAMVVVAAGEYTDIIIVDNSGNNEKIIASVDGVAVEFAGKNGVITLKNGELYSMYMTGSTLLRYGDQVMRGTVEISGSVVSVNTADLTIKTSCSGGVPFEVSGEYMIFVGQRDGVYRIEQISADGTIKLHKDEVIRIKQGDRFTITGSYFKLF